MNISSEHLKSLVLAVSTEIEMGRLTAKDLGGLMTTRFGGTDASGAWSWRMAYDVMEAAVIRSCLDSMPEPDALSELRRLIHLGQSLPTQTRRSEAQLRLQQFTPASYSLIIPMICSSENLRFIVHPFLRRITTISVA